ncbi:MAG: hypothetical protein HOV97_05130 [Nonomuraea sp.]|nr:hypothetical protein [Nonomuraea sp.]
MATWPSVVRNGPNPRKELTINAPAYDADADHSLTPEEHLVQQQWRDVEKLGIAGDWPLSINRDAPEVTSDPYV